MKTSIDRLETGQSGEVSAIQGGVGLTHKLESMGIRTGKRVTKVSGQFMKGPVTIKLEGRQLAMGHGIASKVQVETDPDG